MLLILKQRLLLSRDFQNNYKLWSTEKSDPLYERVGEYNRCVGIIPTGHAAIPITDDKIALVNPDDALEKNIKTNRNRLSLFLTLILQQLMESQAPGA